MTAHQHEPWQIRSGPDGDYCAACGDPVNQEQAGPYMFVRDESHLLQQPGTPGGDLIRELWGESRYLTSRDDDSDDVRTLLDAARDAGPAHPTFLGLVRAAEILRHGPNEATP